MTHDTCERGEDAHRLWRHDAPQCVRYGSALQHTIEPGPEAGKQQQQTALAFVQAHREGASAVSVAAAQRQAVIGQPAPGSGAGWDPWPGGT